MSTSSHFISRQEMLFSLLNTINDNDLAELNKCTFISSSTGVEFNDISLITGESRLLLEGEPKIYIEVCADMHVLRLQILIGGLNNLKHIWQAHYVY